LVDKKKKKSKISVVNLMARPKKFPTKVVRIRARDLQRLRALAKLKKLSVPDYINWRFNK